MTDTGPPLILDCDPGQDDAVALAVAAHYGDLIGVTTVAGNAPLAAVTNNALLTCQLFGIGAPVHSGASKPLEAEPLHAPEIHGASGFDGPALPELNRTVESDGAIEFIIESVRSRDGVWLLQVGPATNVALAIKQAPDIVGRLGGISFMGGSAASGNRTASAEFNALADPEALAVVLASGARLRMCGLDLTSQLVVDDELEQLIRNLSTTGDDGEPSNRGAVVIADLFFHYLNRVERLTGRRRGGLHDPCAILAVTHPELFEMVSRPVGVEVDGSLTRGMTVVDFRDRSGTESVDDGYHVISHCQRLDAEVARQLVLEAIDQQGRSR